MTGRFMPLCLLLIAALRSSAGAETASLSRRGFVFEVDALRLLIKAARDGRVLLPQDELRVGVQRGNDVSWSQRSSFSIQRKDAFTIKAETAAGDFLDVTFTLKEAEVIQVDVGPAPKDADGLAVGLTARADEGYFGFGGPWNGKINQRGEEIRMALRGGNPGTPCLTPFYLSTEGYGIYVEHSGAGRFDMAKSSNNLEQIVFPGGELRFYFLLGASPTELLKRYCDLTGYPPLPPRWAFSMWKWRDEVKSEADLFEDAEMMRRYDIPCGVLLIDNPWQRYGRNSFEMDPERFAEPQKVIQRLHEMGYRIVVWASANTERNVPNFKEGEEKGFFVKDANGATLLRDGNAAWIDFTNPDACTWWKSQMQKILDLGIAGFKLVGGHDLPEQARFDDPSVTRNTYPLSFLRCYFEACRQARGDEFVLLPQAGCSGSQAYTPAMWPGNLEPSFDPASGLPAAIQGIGCLGVSGFPFVGTDTGGFGELSAEAELRKHVFLRWAQLGALSPIFEVGGRGCHEPWNDEVFDEETLTIFRKYAVLRKQIMPYLYSLAHEAHRTGAPLARPLWWEFPDDAASRNEHHSFMLGRALLVAPVYAVSNERDVYLPPGRWVDFWTGEAHDGGRILDHVRAPLDTIPLYARQGSAMPMTATELLASEATEAVKDLMVLDVYAGPYNVLQFYEGAAGSPAQRVVSVADNRGVEVNIASHIERPWGLRIACTRPTQVLQDGHPLTLRATADALWRSAEGWHYDGKGRRVLVKLPRCRFATVELPSARQS